MKTFDPPAPELPRRANTTVNKTNCCSLCVDFAFGEDSACSNMSCPCHTQTTPSEEWAIELNDLLDVSVGLTAASKTLRVALKSFIANTRTAAYEKGVRDSLDGEHKRLLNAFYGSLDLLHRCLKCGETTGKLTYEQALNGNAIGGWCFKCVQKRDSGTTSK